MLGDPSVTVRVVCRSLFVLLHGCWLALPCTGTVRVECRSLLLLLLGCLSR